MWLSTGVTSSALPCSSCDSALSLAPRPLQYFRVCSSPNNEGAAIVISNFEELSSLFCHFCPNRLCSVVIQITGIQKQFKNCPAEPEPIRPCFANMAQPVFLQQELDLLCRLKSLCEPLAPASHKVVLSFLAFLSIRQKEKWFPSPGSEAKRIAQMAVWTGIEFYPQEKMVGWKYGVVICLFHCSWLSRKVLGHQ